MSVPTSWLGPVRLYKTQPTGAITGLVTGVEIRPVLTVELVLDRFGYISAEITRQPGARQYEIELTRDQNEWTRYYIDRYSHTVLGQLDMGLWYGRARVHTHVGAGPWSDVVQFIIYRPPPPDMIDAWIPSGWGGDKYNSDNWTWRDDNPLWVWPEDEKTYGSYSVPLSEFGLTYVRTVNQSGELHTDKVILSGDSISTTAAIPNQTPTNTTANRPFRVVSHFQIDSLPAIPPGYQLQFYYPNGAMVGPRYSMNYDVTFTGGSGGGGGNWNAGAYIGFNIGSITIPGSGFGPDQNIWSGPELPAPAPLTGSHPEARAEATGLGPFGSTIEVGHYITAVVGVYKGGTGHLGMYGPTSVTYTLSDISILVRETVRPSYELRNVRVYTAPQPPWSEETAFNMPEGGYVDRSHEVWRGYRPVGAYPGDDHYYLQWASEEEQDWPSWEYAIAVYEMYLPDADGNFTQYVGRIAENIGKYSGPGV